MQLDPIFKFVSLRAPNLSERAHSISGAITPDEGSFVIIDRFITDAIADITRERTRLGARTFFDSPHFLGHDLGTGVIPWYAAVEDLVKGGESDPARFTDQADVLARELGNLASDQGWMSQALRFASWSSYVAAVIVGEPAQRDIRGLLYVLRLMHGYDAARSGDYESVRSELSKKRAAVPAKYLIFREEQPASDKYDGNDGDKPPADTSARSDAVQRILDLMAARDAIRQAGNNRLKRVIKQQKAWNDAVNKQIQKQKEKNSPSKNPDGPLTSFKDLPEYDVVSGLTKEDISSPEILKKLNEWRLPLSLGEQALIDRLSEMIQRGFRSATSSTPAYQVVWKGHTFARVPVKSTRIT